VSAMRSTLWSPPMKHRGKAIAGIAVTTLFSSSRWTG
jgi:hypothetical protein